MEIHPAIIVPCPLVNYVDPLYIMKKKIRNTAKAIGKVIREIISIVLATLIG